MSLEPMLSHAGFPDAAGPSGIAAVVILDARPDWCRLIEVLVRERLPDVLIRIFMDLADAEYWVAGASMPVVVLTDLDAFGGIGAHRATEWSSRSGHVSVVVLADADEEPDCPMASEARSSLNGRALLALARRPGGLAEWRACIGRALTDAEAWHTWRPWRTPPGPDA